MVRSTDAASHTGHLRGYWTTYFLSSFFLRLLPLLVLQWHAITLCLLTGGGRYLDAKRDKSESAMVERLYSCGHNRTGAVRHLHSCLRIGGAKHNADDGTSKTWGRAASAGGRLRSTKQRSGGATPAGTEGGGNGVCDRLLLHTYAGT